MRKELQHALGELSKGVGCAVKNCLICFIFEHCQVVPAFPIHNWTPNRQCWRSYVIARPVLVTWWCLASQLTCEPCSSRDSISWYATACCSDAHQVASHRECTDSIPAWEDQAFLAKMTIVSWRISLSNSFGDLDHIFASRKYWCILLMYNLLSWHCSEPGLQQ